MQQRSTLFSRRRISNISIIFFFAIVAMLFTLPIYSNSYIPGGDYIAHVESIISAKLALMEGQFPIRLAPAQFYGWGYPYFQFYSPLPYTIAGFIYRIIDTGNPWVAYKITTLIAYTVAGIYTYRLALWLTGQRTIALLSGLTYMAAPYYLINILWRGDFTEAVAQGILPVTLYYSFRTYFDSFNLRRLAFTALAWFALVTTHIITFAYFALFSGILLIVVTLKNPTQWKKFALFCLSAGFGFLLAAWYLAPVILQSSLYIRENLIDPSTYNWVSTFTDLLAIKAVPDHFSIGWTILVAICASIYLLYTRPRNKIATISDQLITSVLALFFIVFFLTWSPVDFWIYIPKEIAIVQFSYRFLAQITWLGTLAMIWMLSTLFPKKLGVPTMIIGVLLIGFASMSWMNSPGRGPYSPHYLAKHNLTLADFTQTVYTTNQHSVPQTLMANLELPLSTDADHLILNAAVLIPSSLIIASKHTALHFEGQVVDHPVTLIANSSNIPFAKRVLPVGHFTWNIPLNTKAAPQDLSFSFKSPQENPTIVIKKLNLTGLPAKLTAVPAAQLLPTCHHTTGSKTNCSFDMPKNAEIAQFPVFYYPNLQHVMLDGKDVPYLAAPFRQFVLVALKLQPGHHDVEIGFDGMRWANYISMMAWISLLLVLVTTFRKRNN